MPIQVEEITADTPAAAACDALGDAEDVQPIVAEIRTAGYVTPLALSMIAELSGTAPAPAPATDDNNDS